MFSSELWQKSGVSTYSIDQSIRFNQADNASMSRTPSSASNKRTWTFSWWWKRGALSGSTNGTNQRQPIFGTTAFSILSNHNSTQIDGINVVYTGAANDVQTSEKFRDVSAWYNFQAVLDTTNDVASERFRLYKNGQRITDFASISYPAKDTEYTVNNTQAHYIGLRSSGENLDGYLAEIVFIDGQALTPSSFGEENDNGIWIPKDVSGLTFGTNGFWIDGRDSSDLGDDESGQGNDFTASGLAAHDQMTGESPTNNFCVLNPILNMTHQYLTADIRDTNLASQAVSASLNNYAIGSMGVTSGKWYFEAEYPTYPALSGARVGFISLENASSNIGGSSYGKEKTILLSNRHTTSAFSNFEWGNGSSYPNTSATSQTPFVQDDIIGVAFDCDNSTIQFYKNGSTFGSQFDYSAQSNAVDTSDGDTYAPIIMGDNTNYTNKVVLNFGQDSTFNGGTSAGGNSDGNGIGNFKYSVPSGYLALCTKNLGS